MTDSQTDGRTLAARYLKGLNDHDPDAVDGFVAVDYINHNAFVENGREANRAFWSSFFTAFPDIEATMDDLVVAGDRVVGRFTYRGTHDGPLYGVPATGNAIEMRSIDIWRTENGEFAEHWDEVNYLELFQQIGMIPAFDLGDTESTTQPGTSQPAGGPDAPAGTPYPDIADTSHATAAAAAFFRSFFTAKTSKDIEATHAHFHPGQTVYFDATLGWALTANTDVRNMWEQYMPQWPAEAKSYPTQILGDMTSAVVFVTDTPELFGGEIRTISIADLQDGKIVRLVDYWDGRGFGAELAGSLRVPADSYPHDLGVSTVTSRPGPVATAARELSAAFAAGDADGVGGLFSYDAVFEDMALRTQLRGQAAIVRYLRRALPGLPYARASVRHVAGAGQGGGYEWHADGQPVAVGAAALELSQDGKITKFTVIWDGSLLDDQAITALAADAVDR